MSLKAAGLIAEDLLCGSSEAVSSRLLLADGQKRANVVLRIEVATSADTKVLVRKHSSGCFDAALWE